MQLVKFVSCFHVSFQKLPFLIIVLTFMISSNIRAKTPKWIQAPYTICNSAKEFCTVAESSTLNMAKEIARNDISLIFQTRIKSKITSSENESEIMGQAAGTQRSEFSRNAQSYYYSQFIQESDVELSSIQIREHFYDNEKKSYFVLASLNKLSEARKTQGQIADLNSRLSKKLNEQSLAKLNSYFEIIDRINLLNEKYIVLTGGTINSLINKRSVHLEIENKKQAIKSIIEFKVEPNSAETKNDHVDILGQLLKEHLYQIGYRGPSDKEKAYYYIGLNEKLQEIPFDVKYFQKHKVVFTATLLDAEKRVLNKMIYEKYFTGRNKQQIIQKAKDDFKKYLQAKVSTFML